MLSIRLSKSTGRNVSSNELGFERGDVEGGDSLLGTFNNSAVPSAMTTH